MLLLRMHLIISNRMEYQLQRRDGELILKTSITIMVATSTIQINSSNNSSAHQMDTCSNRINQFNTKHNPIHKLNSNSSNAVTGQSKKCMLRTLSKNSWVFNRLRLLISYLSMHSNFTSVSIPYLTKDLL